MFSYGNKFKIQIYGASHEKNMGIIIEGIKPGTKIDLEKIKFDLEKRKPSKIGTTKRIEEDCIKVENGVLNGLATGAPIHFVLYNNNVKSEDYENISTHYRPSHADYAASVKYDNFNDKRGGGFFSGRLTALFVIAGSIAKSLILPVSINSEITKVGDLDDMSKLDEYLLRVTDDKDSVGGEVISRITGLKAGIGDPYFEKLDANLAKMIVTIPGVRGIIFGEDFSPFKRGSENNDLLIDENGKTSTNHSGGINGGISNGNDVVFKTLVKPTSSIGINQNTFNFQTMKRENLLIEGRHDVAFIRRIPIVIESFIAITLANYLL